MIIKKHKYFEEEPNIQESFEIMVDDDMMTPEEAGFMQGYEEAA